MSILLVCWASYIRRRSLFARIPDFGAFSCKWRNRLSGGQVWCIAMFPRISAKATVGHPTEELGRQEAIQPGLIPCCCSNCGEKNSPWSGGGNEIAAKPSGLGGLGSAALFYAEIIERHHLGRLHGILLTLLWWESRRSEERTSELQSLRHLVCR